MTEHDKHLARAATLSGAEKITYMRENDITGEQMWRYGVIQAKKVTKKGRGKTTKMRERALIAQDWVCALCEVSDANKWCLDKTGKAICYRCNQFLVLYRKLRADGVEYEDMETFVSESE